MSVKAAMTAAGLTNIEADDETPGGYVGEAASAAAARAVAATLDLDGYDTSVSSDGSGFFVWACRAVGHGTLTDYATGESIRPALGSERAASIEAAKSDGGSGVIKVDGRSCYVAR